MCSTSSAQKENQFGSTRLSWLSQLRSCEIQDRRSTHIECVKGPLRSIEVPAKSCGRWNIVKFAHQH